MATYSKSNRSLWELGERPFDPVHAESLVNLAELTQLDVPLRQR